ncbi:MAG: hypothetical protein ABI763_09330 [Bacteroidota bacterium]
MKRIANLLIIFIVIAVFSSCKDEVIIPDNAAPPDQTIENVTISNYVNRVYVSVLGREASESEKSSGFNVLRQNNLSNASRAQFLGQVFSSPNYLPHLYDFARTELLNNLDTADITFYIYLFNLALNDPDNILVYDVIAHEIERLDSLQRVPSDLAGSQIDIIHLHKRCADNYFYDQINMGTENFVVSCFQHFLSRYPTANELSEGKKIVEGMPGILFLQTGQSKDEFLNIFFSSRDYFEGLAINLYNRFLLRNPTSIEMGNAVQAFGSSHDYVQMQKDILSTNEYIGIE